MRANVNRAEFFRLMTIQDVKKQRDLGYKVGVLSGIIIGAFFGVIGGWFLCVTFFIMPVGMP